MPANTKPTVKKEKTEELPHPDSYYAMRIVVPVANPKTALSLLKLAHSLVHPTKGKIIALFVNNPDSPYKDALQEIEKICENAKKNGLPIELVTIVSHHVARGILDITRERNADLTILGFQVPKDGKKITLGDVTEAVARVISHDLVVYRSNNEAIERIVVPATTLENTRMAMIHALHLSQAYQKPVIALFVKDHKIHYADPNHTNPFWLQRSRIYDAIYSLPDSENIETEIIEAQDLVSGIQSFCKDTDLIVYPVGFQQDEDLDRKWVFGPAAERILRLAPGSLAIIRRGNKQATLLEQLANQIERLRPMLTIDERTEVMQETINLARANTNFIVMIMLSSILATVGLLQNSTAVIIGAMLVAPLMSPLMGFGAGLALGNLQTMRRSSVTVLYGVLLVIVVSFVIGTIFSIPTPTSEMLSRGQPNLLDLVVAIASGAAGAFAMARRDVPAALAGVAIAAALVPPICTTGLALAIGHLPLFIGAGALSVVNIIGISITSAGVFAAMGIHQKGMVPTRQRLIISFTIILLMAIPLTFLLRSNFIYLNTSNTVKTVLEEELGNATVTDVEIEGGENMKITATIRSPYIINSADVKTLETKLEDRLERDIDLSIVFMQVVEVDFVEEQN